MRAWAEAVVADQQRVVDRLDDFLSWLREPLTAMPIDRVMARLRVAYQINVASWREQRGDLLTQMVFDRPTCCVTTPA